MTLDDYKKQVARIPDTPGVYFFLNKQKKVLYIGKATSLKDRTRSYFAPDIAMVRSQLIANMVAEAKTIDWRQTDSVLEALLLEANLVRTHKPHANTDLKDDKSFNYVVITKENFPKVLMIRGKDLELLRESKLASVHDFSAEKSLSPRAVALRSHLQTSFTPLHTFGPFPHGTQLKEALRIIRKIFPYRDEKCIPCAEQKFPQGVASGICKPCFNRHIGLCPGVCTGEITKVEYAKIIRRIVLLFQGKKSVLLSSLERDMKLAAKHMEFEEATRLRGQVFALNHIQDVSLIKDEYRSTSFNGSYPGSANTRIEGYDAAHLQGSSAVGVMTVVVDGMPQKSEYRKFILKSTTPGDDPGALQEILTRRLGHPEWPLPRLIVVDGATAQIAVAEKVLHELGMQIPVVGVVKDEKHRPKEIRGNTAIVKGKEKEVLLVNSEAHRYAIGFHRAKSRRQLLQ